MAAILNEVSTTLIGLLLPEGILDYFDLTKVTKDATGVNIFLEEKSIALWGYQNMNWNQRAFYLKFVSRTFLSVVRKRLYALEGAAGRYFLQTLPLSGTRIC